MKQIHFRTVLYDILEIIKQIDDTTDIKSA